MNPSVSVIIPAYTAETSLSETLDCVINQTLKNIEILFVDDGSTDRTLDVICEYADTDPRIKILHTSHEGAGAARNTGMASARGEYLSFLDADDLFDAQMLEKSYLLAQRTQADIVVFKYCEQNFMTGELWHDRGLSHRAIEHGGNIAIGIDGLSWTTPAPWNKLFRHAFLKEHELRFQNLRTCNDFAFTKIATLAARRIFFLNEELLIYRKNPHNISSTRYYYASNIIEAGKEILLYIKNNTSFHNLKPFYKMMFNHCMYEYEQFPTSQEANIFIKHVILFLPFYYRYKFIKRVIRGRIKNLLNTMFCYHG